MKISRRRPKGMRRGRGVVGSWNKPGSFGDEVASRPEEQGMPQQERGDILP